MTLPARRWALASFVLVLAVSASVVAQRRSNAPQAAPSQLPTGKVPMLMYTLAWLGGVVTPLAPVSMVFLKTWMVGGRRRSSILASQD